MGCSMGCGNSKASVPVAATSQEAVKLARKTVADKLTAGMAVVKQNCQKQMEESNMIAKVLEVMRYYEQCALKDSRSMEIFKCSMMGHTLARDRRYKTNVHFAKALQKILSPDRLSSAKNVSENMFDFSDLSNRVKLVVDQMAEDGCVDPEPDSDDDTKAVGGFRKQKKAKSKVKASGPEKDRQDMVKLLTPLYELCEHMQQNLMDKANISAQDRDDMKSRIAQATFAIKVFDFEKRGKDVKRAVFVGPESIGKSTVLNYIVSEGKGSNFMHTSSGMGTQIPCIISNAATETLSLDGQQLSSTGFMSELMKSQTEKIRKTKLKDVNAFRATTPFNPPFELELIDVPGIKGATKLMSQVTLSISSTLVICLGKVETARSKLKDPASLKLLTEIAQSLGREINLVCLITLEVPPAEFNAKPYQALLREFFPKARHPAKIIYANFKNLDSLDKKQEALNTFYGELKKHRALPSDPHRIFFELSTPLNAFLQKVSTGLRALMKPFNDEFDHALRDEVSPSLGDTSKISEKVVKAELQRKQFGKHKVFDISGDKQFPTFSVGMNEKHVAQVKDDVLIAQELVFECRMAIMEWLGEVSMLLHGLGFARHFDPIASMIAKDEDDDLEEVRRVLCDNFCRISGSHAEAKPNVVTRQHWETQYANRVGQFFTCDAFPWVMIGYYMVRSDGETKHQLLDSFVQNPSPDGIDWVDTWNKDLTEALKKLPKLVNERPEGWVPKCQQQKTRQGTFKELFNCMHDACSTYEQIVNDKALCHWGEPLKNLYEICFATLQRLIVVKPWKSDMQFTSFATHLRQGTVNSVQLSQLVDQISNSEDTPQADLCKNMLDVMKSCGATKIKKWRDIVDALEEDLEIMMYAKQAFETSFVQTDFENVAVILPRIEDGDSSHPDDARRDGTSVSGELSGWEIAAGPDGSYIPCSDDIATLLGKWIQQGKKEGYWATQKKGPVTPLTHDEAMAKSAGNGAQFVYKVDLVALKQINLGTKRERQLKPVGRQAKLMRSATNVSSKTSSGPLALPEHIQAVLEKLKSSRFQSHHLNPKHADDVVYAKAAINHIRNKGSKVVIYVRRDDEYSSDPVGVDQDILCQLAQEPNVFSCFVLWQAPESVSNWDNPETVKNWNEISGDVEIKLLAVNGSADVNAFIQDLEAAVHEATDSVKDRLEKKRETLTSSAKTFQREAVDFMNDRNKADHKTASWFQKYLREDTRAISKKTIEKLTSQLDSSGSPIKMAIPAGDFLSGLPDFLPAAVENVAGADDQASSINELECRAFLVNILLGQTLQHAQDIAGRLYDEGFAKVLDDIGSWFFMDGQVLLKELETFCDAGKAEDQEDMLKDFLSRDHFVHMFTGCALWNVMPMLYCLILPTLWDKQGAGQKSRKQQVSATMYDYNLKRVLEMLK